MNSYQSNISDSKSQPQMDDREQHIVGTTLLEFIRIILEWRKFIVRFVLFVTIVTVMIVLLLPKWYKSTASVFPAEKADILGSLDGGVSSLVKSFGGGKLGLGKGDAERYIAILKSERMLTSVIAKFDLIKVYEITSYPREKTLKELISNIEIEIQDEGNLDVSVYDTDPKRAAAMANFFVEQLNKINTEINVQNAKANREFVEQRYQKNLDDIKIAEEEFRAFQIINGVIAVPQQIEASIKSGAELMGQLALKEIEQGVLISTMSSESPQVKIIDVEILELKKKLDDMRNGSDGDSSTMKIFLLLNRTPQLATDYLRLFRNLEIQNKILQFITPVYEQAKVEEKRNTPSVVILDYASVSERKSRPKVSLFALLSFVVSLLISLFIVFFIEMMKKMRTINPTIFDKTFSDARADWFGLRSSKRKI